MIRTEVLIESHQWYNQLKTKFSTRTPNDLESPSKPMTPIKVDDEFIYLLILNRIKFQTQKNLTKKETDSSEGVLISD